MLSWLDGQPPWRDGEGTVVSTWSLIGTAAGDRLQHRLELLPPSVACERAAAGRPESWVILDRADARARGREDCGIAPGHEDPHYRAYGPRAGGGR